MSKQMNLKRIITTLIGSVFVCALVLGIAGCARSNAKELIRADVEEAMEIFKNPTEENLKPYLEDSDADLSTLDEYGIDIYEFCEHAFKHFDYTIDDVKVDGNVATVDLTVSNVNLEEVSAKVTEDITANISDYADIIMQEDGEKQMYGIIFDRLYEELDAATATVQSQATLTYTKDGNTWSVDEDSMQNLIGKMFGGISI